MRRRTISFRCTNVEPGYIVANDERSLFLSLIKARWPQIDETSAQTLCELWDHELDHIIAKMFEIAKEVVPFSLHIDSRPELTFTLAKLSLFLSEKIVEVRSKDHGSTIDVAKEAEALSTSIAEDRRQGTAKNCAEAVWIKTIKRLRVKHPLIISVTPKSKIITPMTIVGHVGDNHFSPKFANREWANTTGKVRVYSRGINGRVIAIDKDFSRWGFERNLYSNQLERYLSVVDGDGARSAKKILTMIPMSAAEKHGWIVFLAVQFIRTPRMLDVMSRRIKVMLPSLAPGYPDTPAGIKAVFETLFKSEKLYAHFHQLISPRSWNVLKAPTGSSFLRSDNPVTIAGDAASSTWNLLYPMTPRSVFVVGPELGNGIDALFVRTRTVTDREVEQMNGRIASSAFQSVIGVSDNETESLRSVINRCLCSNAESSNSSLEGLWGELTQ